MHNLVLSVAADVGITPLVIMTNLQLMRWHAAHGRIT